MKLSSPKWNRALYGAGGANQHDRIEDAAELNWEAAHKAAAGGRSKFWGRPTGPPATARPGLCRRDARRRWRGPRRLRELHEGGEARRRVAGGNWAAFARSYNGPAYAQNAYDKKMAARLRALESEKLIAEPRVVVPPPEPEALDYPASVGIALAVVLTSSCWSLSAGWIPPAARSPSRS